MLQQFLDANLLPITDANYFDKLKKSADEVSKKLSKNKSKILSYVLSALDPDIPANNPDILEVKELISKNWSTFSTNSKDTPVTFIRAVMLEALEIISAEINEACLIWLAARNIQYHLKLFGKEKELITQFLLSLGIRVENEAIETWSLPSESKLQKLIVELKAITGTTVDKTELENHLKAASIHSGLGDGGENPQYPSNNALAWPQFFSQRASQGLTDVINKALKAQANNLSTNQTQIQEAVNKLIQSEILERTRLLHLRTQLLWWKESCYSPSLKKSYRGQTDGLLQISLATDYSSFVPTIYPTSADYFLKETHRMLVQDESKKITISEILKQIEQSREALKNIFTESTAEPGRISLLSFIRGFVWGKYSFEQFKSLVGFDHNTEMVLSDFTIWLFHDLQSLKISISK